MIDESGPWRAELWKSAIRLRRWNIQKRWTSRTYFLAERDIMMGAYSIRRLIDSGKSSSRLPGKRYQVRQYPITGRTPMVLDRFSPERFYDIGRPANGELSVSRLCNQIIHSFVFQIHADEDSTTGVIFVSDHDRHKHLYGMGFERLAHLFDYVAREDVVETHGTMEGGVQIFRHTSNHDLVEDGLARYIDDEGVYIERHQDADERFDMRVRDLIAKRGGPQRTGS
ncbi:hypothetical protein [Microbacterium trichothecenolyticum]|uniref:Uncharacterized protein n=1 Tax=Microbacterium trichothecenolyticum TaxID=69370 RepID=A0ABU0U0X7_MICTR|nr:hypothetical protein [Microbacterium trichothecenolyticum]MDQ1124877.1 hypothetical protein [Microbacterium trichothecenolyticum]